MKTLENNKLIAEFMGHEIHNRGFITEGGNVYSFDKNEIAPYCGYDTDWNELMPVVEKIERIKGVHFVISELGCDIYSFGYKVSDTREETKILTIYQAVVEFIKWVKENNAHK